MKRTKQEVQTFWTDISAIVLRHLISLVTIVMGSVIGLLLYFGESRDAIFIASVLTINILVGIAQEVRARLMLEKLAAVMDRQVRLLRSDGTVDLIPLSKMKVGEVIKLKAGDQLPADGIVQKTTAFELTEAFLTGETKSLSKPPGAFVYAGSFVSAGEADLEVVVIGQNTRIGQMTARVKRYSVHLTPIGRALAGLITALSYVLLVAVLALVFRDSLQGGDSAVLIKQIAALTGTIIPEGLVLASTLLFAYGAIKLLRRRVLLQDIHSAESLARVQILCLDKTGTLTESKLCLDGFTAAPGSSSAKCERLVKQYFSATDPAGEMAQALGLGDEKQPPHVTLTAFSSQRRYGVISAGATTIICGAPDSLMRVFRIAQSDWIARTVAEQTSRGHRVILCATTASKTAPHKGARLTSVGLVSFAQPIKASARPTLDFFSARSVSVKVISGDHPRAVARVAQDLNIETLGGRVIQGEDLVGKDQSQLVKLMREQSLFARISPVQKAQLIKAAQKLGYVGMVGDGANDALAVKQADIGISMFAAADVTRTVADIVLIKNDFADLPDGVNLADSIITSLELIGALFLNKVIIGLTILTCAFLTNQAYPFTPRNITVLNYFIIGLPILLWTLYPQQRRRTAFEPSYLRQIMPFVIMNGIITVCVSALAFVMTRAYVIDIQMTLFVTTLLLGMGMLLVAPAAMGIASAKGYTRKVFAVFAISFVLLTMLFVTPVLREFFGISVVRADWLALGIGLATGGIAVQLLILRHRAVSRVADWLTSGNL